MTVERALEILTPHNHELYRLFKARCDAGYPMTMIAAEIGVHVDDLCDWVLKVYREPKKQKPYSTRHMEAIGEVHNGNGAGWSLSEQTRRHLAWKRQREGARAALEAME